MKRNRQTTSNQTRSLRAHDLAVVRGGNIGITRETIVGGSKAVGGGGLHPDKWFVD